MAKDILRNVRIFVGGVDLTGHSNKIDVAAEVEERDTTNFGSVDLATGQVWKDLIGGIGAWKLGAGGQWQAGDPTMVDDQMWDGLEDVSGWTAAVAGTVGAAAYVGKALESSYMLGGAHGDVAPWTGAASGTGALGRGAILHPPGTARTATGNGTAVQVGAIPDEWVAVANLHVLSVAGTSTPTITVKIQSDDNSGFTSPTDRLTFAAATAVGGQSLTLLGPIADTYWRAIWTISGTTPSFLLVASLGFGRA